MSDTTADDTRRIDWWWWTPDPSPMGSLEKSTVHYALIGWLIHHAVAFVDPAYFDVPFVTVALFAIFGLAKGLDQSNGLGDTQEEVK